MDVPHSDLTTGPLFASLLGSTAFATLPASVLHLHQRQGRSTFVGEVVVVRGTGLLARLCGWATRLPPSGHGAITVTIDSSSERETWTRHVAGHAMRSRLWAVDGLLTEKLGLVTFGFALSIEQGQLIWRVERVRALGFIPLPRRAFSAVKAREGQDRDRYTFDVTATLPFVGPLVHYRGWLNVPY